LEQNKYLFVLSPWRSGSTALAALLASSANVSWFGEEGQVIPAFKGLYPDYWPRRWQPDLALDWQAIKSVWRTVWDTSRPVLLEKSPPHVLRARAIEDAFEDVWFLQWARDPYATCEVAQRRLPVSYAHYARWWGEINRLQMEHERVLKHALRLTYEQFSSDPQAAKEALVGFVPELEDLDPCRSLAGDDHVREGALLNVNEECLARLKPEAVREITSVLSDYSDVMDFWGYRLR
jgi:hypothetical protein